MCDAAGKSLEKCRQGCGGKRTEGEYKNSIYDLGQVTTQNMD